MFKHEKRNLAQVILLSGVFFVYVFYLWSKIIGGNGGDGDDGESSLNDHSRKLAQPYICKVFNLL